MPVFVLGRNGRPLMPCSEKRARKLLGAGRARVHRRYPFTLRLIDRQPADSRLQALELKLDPGSQTTGLALCRVAASVDGDGVVHRVMHIRFLMELVHRGRAIKQALQARSAMRRRRRGNLRYRAPRFDNRTRKAGWLPPSLQHRVDTTMAWARRLCKLAPVTHIAQELVRFDMQLMQNAEISGVEYQQGELAGYEVREYLLEKFGRSCQYCDATGVPLQVEHIHAKARGGSSRVSNLALACAPCNQKKDSRDIRAFLAQDPTRLARILARAKAPLRDAAAVNTTRWALFEALKGTGLSVSTASGAQTKCNRTRLGLPKTHSLDAACTGQADGVTGAAAPVLVVKCSGRGSRSRTRLNQFGFPRAYLSRSKTAFGFRTGDMVLATVPNGKKAGTYQGRVAIRQTGSFNIQSGKPGVPTVQGISQKHCKVLQRGDGYGYACQPSPYSTTKGNEACGLGAFPLRPEGRSVAEQLG
ncbi:hypothetical protein PTE30175_03737 [Pandoraea terrae]|uniref:HNH nuclease domain-containing protein n=2 Tax=Pandoraea terrae TaxID=1537710 RepID=A0A5E4XDZ4_9BURK|nr:RNA-guided endonuclease IscB [Pandoraea terrae]VVE34649.1 hypothetical protein PTE30175_03737 [Pandoraea terrae]